MHCIDRGTTWANQMNFVLIHAGGAGSIAQPDDQQSYHRATDAPLQQG